MNPNRQSTTPTIHIISVGTSINKQLGNTRKRHYLPDPLVNGFGDSEDVDDLVQHLATTLTGTGEVPSGVGLRSINDGRERACSAELEVLNYAEVSPERDVIVLVASDTLAGISAVVWVWATLAIHDERWRPVRVLGTPDGFSFTSTDKVIIVRVPGLRSTTDEMFAACMASLGHLMGETRKKLHRSDYFNVDIHLSGGYKAALPYLLALTELLNSPPSPGDWQGDHGRVRAILTHDEEVGGDADNARPSSHSVSLRQHDMGRTRSVLELFEGDDDTYTGGASFADAAGSLYTVEADGSWRLTDYGRAFKVFFRVLDSTTP